MCGIIGYIGERDAASLILAGLKHLEYRGYDSAGIAVLHEHQISVRRSTGKLRNLEEKLKTAPLVGSLGIGHTRWATHGRPTDENAHPHTYRQVSVVHNGILENHIELKERLIGEGHAFSSETDSEVFAHLIEAELRARKCSLQDAVRSALVHARGTYALVALSSDEPDAIICARDAQPLLLGLGKGENFIASDVAAVLESTREVIYLNDGDLAEIRRGYVKVWDRAGTPVARPSNTLSWNIAVAEKDGHKHFMHKEIFEQPRAVADTLRGRALRSAGDVHFDGWTIDEATARAIERMWIVACGTSYHSGLVGRWYLEHIARLPVNVELASEFRYRDPILGPHELALAVTQSGETLDTLGALRKAKSLGASTLGLCNVVGSAMTREADACLMTHAGPEIGVASTKAFTTQLAMLALVSIRLGRLRGTLSAEAARLLLEELTSVPALLDEVLSREAAVKAVASRYLNSRGYLFLGRGPYYPVALEGALKLKEISYSHAEGYAGGEMKHGPIALIDESLPVVVIAPSEPRIHYEKIVGNLQEVRARGAPVISIVDERDTQIAKLSDATLTIPAASEFVSPLIATLPLQLFAYHIADMRGTDVDQPRNLAKSVTVE